ncbi:hypothetical protein Barb6_03192 [Bacteroidales bacterium Barb6]|nr:hypothetical protein Barb6_03192 [Bacteroidales bacterium Barb6]
MVKTECGSQCGLPVLACLFNVNVLNEPTAVLANVKAVYAGNDERLPRLQDEFLSGMFSHVMGEYRNKFNNTTHGLFTELITVILHEGKKSLCRQPDIFAGDNPARNHILCILTVQLHYFSLRLLFFTRNAPRGLVAFFSFFSDEMFDRLFMVSPYSVIIFITWE